MLKEPVEVVYDVMEESIGQPMDIATNLKASPGVDFNVEIPIPRPLAAMATTAATTAATLSSSGGAGALVSGN